MNQSILIIDPEPAMREVLSNAFRLHGFQTAEVGEPSGARRLLEQQAFDGLLCDPRSPGDEGFELLASARKHNPNLIIIFMLSQQSARKVIKAIQMGADDYVLKPFSIDEVVLKFRRALDARMLQSENLALREQLRDRQMLTDILGTSKAAQELTRLVQLVARTSSTVLITGEAGTGKEHIARVIHRLSGRANPLMQSVNCAAVPKRLLEEQLWGYIQGASSEALQDRPGSFALADKGTIFLDEISSLPQQLQTRLLRVIQDREISPLGSEKTLPADVRIIAASRIDIRELVQQERFREDLFYRLNVIPIHVPPLRQRREDIPALAAHFIARITARQGLPAKTLSPAARRWMLGFDWPGNVGQLETSIEMACALSGSRAVLQPEDFQPAANPRSMDSSGIPEFDIPSEGINLNAVLETAERRLIEKALLLTRGNRNQAARLLGLKRTTLVEKIKKWKD